MSKRSRTSLKSQQPKVPRFKFTTKVKPTLSVETRKAEGAVNGFLNNPREEDRRPIDRTTPQMQTQDDDSWRLAPWVFTPFQTGYLSPVSAEDLRAGRGILARGIPPPGIEVATPVGTGTDRGQKLGEGVDLIEQCVLQSLGLRLPEMPEGFGNVSPVPVREDPQRPVLDDDQRETLFQNIFAQNGRIPVPGKQNMWLIIYKARCGLFHLCVELPHTVNTAAGKVIRTKAHRVCTEPGCYRYDNTESTNVLPKCEVHRGEHLHVVVTVADYKRPQERYISNHMFRTSVSPGADARERRKQAIHTFISRLSGEINLPKGPSKEVWIRLPKIVEMYYFRTEQEAAKKLSVLTTLGLFQNLLPHSSAGGGFCGFVYLPHGLEAEVDLGLKKDLGVELYIRRQLRDREWKMTPFPFGTDLRNADPETLKKEEGLAFLYILHNYEMMYGGWTHNPRFQTRPEHLLNTDSIAKYALLNPTKPIAPTVIGSCDKDQKEHYEACMQLGLYIGQLLGFRNPLRKVGSERVWCCNRVINSNVFKPDSINLVINFVKYLFGFEIAFKPNDAR